MPLRQVSSADLAFACLLAALAGIVDAIGFSMLGSVFVSFMSGNTTRLGLAVVAGRWDLAATIIRVIVAFVCGAAAGSGIGIVGPRWRRAVLLSADSVVLFAAAVLGMSAWHESAAVAMAFGMGMENELLVDRSGTGVSLTFVSGTLVKIGESLARIVLEGFSWEWARLLAVWLSLLAGVAAGGLAYVRAGLPTLFAVSLVFLGLAASAAATATRQAAR